MDMDISMEIFLGLPDTQSQYSFFQQAKFKRALLLGISYMESHILIYYDGPGPAVILVVMFVDILRSHK